MRLQVRHSIVFFMVVFISINAFAQNKDLLKGYAKQKALFMYGFTKYIQWPQAQSYTYFKIGILGKNNLLYNELQKISATRTFHGKPFKITMLSRVSDASDCHMLYADAQSGHSIQNILSAISESSTLLVSEGYPYKSSMINFVLINDNINYTINSDRLERQRLYYTSDLIKLSTSLDEWQKNYAEVVEEFINTKQRSLSQEEKIQKLLLEQQKQQRAINSSIIELKKQEQKLQDQKTQIESMIDLNYDQKNKLLMQMRDIGSKNNEIELKSTELEKQELDLLYQNQKSNRQKKQIHYQRGEIDTQKEVMKENSSKIESQNLQLNISFIVLFFIATLAALISWLYRQKQEANKLLEQKNLAIESQKNQIEQKNIAITSSINYAKRIQEAVLPTLEDVKEVFPDSFVMNAPKDIVSGDFYWLHKSKYSGNCIFAVADCTGHGVPGAFMSLVSFTLLNQIVIEKQIEEPAQILDLLREGIIEALHQKGNRSEAKDGLDIALCVFNPKASSITYAGARNPLYHVSKEELLELKADAKGIGFEKGEKKPFKSQTIKVHKNDMIYLFSDGFVDQRGGSKNKKYYYGPFRKLLMQNAGLPTHEQHSLLKQEFEAWKGTNYQIDDVCIMGIRIG